MPDPVAEARQAVLDYMPTRVLSAEAVDALIEAVREDVRGEWRPEYRALLDRIAELEEALRDSRRHAISVLDRSREVLGE